MGLTESEKICSIIKNLEKENKRCFENPDVDFSDVKNGECTCRNSIILFFLKENQRYRSIGRVDKCREAIEKQNPQLPDIWGDGCDKEGNIIYDMYDCPGCGQSYEIDYKYKHCPECGQAIDWGGFEDL